MLGAVWLCVLALALPCWTYPSGHNTTCEEFGCGVRFDPVNAVGEWFAVYLFTNAPINTTVTGKYSIKELTSSQLEQYDQVLRGYSKDKIKFKFTIRSSALFDSEHDYVLVPQDDVGNVDAWLTRLQINFINVPIPNLIPERFKWKSMDGFLVMMNCESKNMRVLSKITTPGEDKLKRAVDSLHIEGITGHRAYPMTTLL